MHLKNKKTQQTELKDNSKHNNTHAKISACPLAKSTSFNRFNQNYRYINESTCSWTFAKHKRSLTKLLKALKATIEDVIVWQLFEKGRL